MANSCTQGFQSGSPDTNKSGIVFFPEAWGCIATARLWAALELAAMGVDQDDYVTAGGAVGFAAPAQIRADQLVINNVRLPYLKFPANPTN